MTPLLTIITVTFNAEKLVEETIQSVLKQTFTDYEYWIIDGGSNDGTLDLIKNHAEKINWISEKDDGIYHAMNKGIEKSQGHWLYFLNAGDTLFDENVLKSIFEKPIPENIELIYGNIKTKNHPSGSNYTIGNAITLASFYYRIGLCHQAAFARRTAFEAIGNYRSAEYTILADQEWFVRFLKSGREACYLNMTVANYEVVGESFLQRKQNHQDHLKIVKNNFSSPVVWLNIFCAPGVKLKIWLLQKLGDSAMYKRYRHFFFRDER